MRTFGLVPLFVLLVGPAAMSAEEEKSDRDRFQGMWEIVKMEQAGKDQAEFLKNQSPKLVFEGDKYTFKGDGIIERGEFKLDSKAKISTLDYTITEGEHKGKRQLGIYRLDGDTLKICLAEEGASTRPSSFTTRENAPEYVLFILKRHKKEK